MKQVLSFVKKETILCVAIFLAILSSFFIGIDKEYIDYIDYHTLAILFCLMTVMSGLRENDVFDWLAQRDKSYFC